MYQQRILKTCSASLRAWKQYARDLRYFSFPERIAVELTNACNLACSICPRNMVKMKIGFMDFSLFIKIVDEAAHHLPIALVPFFRGEPFLHPKFFDMLKYAKEKGLSPIQLATNAHYFTYGTAKRILGLDIDFISFSIGHSDFKIGFKNVLKFLELKKKSRLKKPQVQVSAVKTPDTKLFIKDFISYWRPKVDRVRIYHQHSSGGKFGHSEDCIEAKKRRPCLKLLTDMVIYWDGDVAICNHDWHRDLFIGNIRNDSISDIWNGSVYNKIRRMHLADNLEKFSPCNHCSHWQIYYNKKRMIGELYEG